MGTAFKDWDKLFASILWTECLGILPLIVYGVKGKLKEAFEKTGDAVRASMRFSFKRPSKIEKKPSYDSTSARETEEDTMRLLPFLGIFIFFINKFRTWINEENEEYDEFILDPDDVPKTKQTKKEGKEGKEDEDLNQQETDKTSNTKSNEEKYTE